MWNPLVTLHWKVQVSCVECLIGALGIAGALFGSPVNKDHRMLLASIWGPPK